MSHIKTETRADGKIREVIFNNPEKLNALTLEDEEELKERLIEIENDDDVKVVVLKGAGSHFGSGHDVEDIGPHHGWDEEDRRPSIRRRMEYDDRVMWGRRGVQQVLYSYKKVVVAQVQGYCYGGHLQLALMADIIVASEDAKFGHPGYQYIGPLGNIVMAILSMGTRRAKELMLTGEPMTAEEALECGFANHVVPEEDLEAKTEEVVESIAGMPYDAIAMGKANFELALDILGVGTGGTAAVVSHLLQTNIRYEPEEFNLLREKDRRDAGSDLFEQRDEQTRTDLRDDESGE